MRDVLQDIPCIFFLKGKRSKKKFLLNQAHCQIPLNGPRRSTRNKEIEEFIQNVKSTYVLMNIVHTSTKSLI